MEQEQLKNILEALLFVAGKPFKAKDFAKILEINAHHQIIKKISDAITKNDHSFSEELVLALFDQACIIEGEPVSDISAFSKRMNNLLARI